MELEPYSEYKEVDLPWLDKIPNEWDIRRAKFVFHPIDIRSEKGKENLLTVSSKNGIVPRETANVTMFKAESYEGYKLCWPGDLVINSLWAWMTGLGFSRQHGIISSAYGVYRPIKEYSDYWRFLDYMLRSKAYNWEFTIRSRGIWTSRLQINDDRFLDMLIILPPHDEMKRIVQYLDTKSAQISEYIKSKQRLIQLLEEQKQTIINQVVTRGLNPNVKFKPSSVDWLGEIPEDWKVKKIKFATKIIRGRFNHRPRNDPTLYDGKFPFIQTGDVATGMKYIESYNQTLNEKGYSVSKEFPKYTLVMTIAANIGEVSILGFDACFPDSIVGFIPKKDIYRDYLYYVFRALKPELLKLAPVTTQGNLNIERVGNIRIPICSQSVQKDIVKHIEKNANVIEEAHTVIIQDIEKLKEYQNKIIYDAVTGKIYVGGNNAN